MSPQKYLRELTKALPAGWTVTHRGSGHLAISKAGYQTIFTGATPSCPFALKKTLRDVQREEQRGPRSTAA